MAVAIQSRVYYDGDGTTTNFTFAFPYLDRDHIRVEIDEVATGDYIWVSEYEIQLTVAPAVDTKLQIYRETPKDEPIVEIKNGSSLRSQDLNIQALQAMYIAQEAIDQALITKASTLRAPDSDAGRVELTFPSIEERANGILGFDNDGQIRAFTGDDMPKGPTGDKGPQGDQGPIGPQGAMGPTGPQGIQGPVGQAFVFDAEGTLANRATHDAAAQGFSYIDYENGNIYFKLSATNADWSNPFPFANGATGAQGPAGADGAAGPQGPQGLPGVDGKSVAVGTDVAGYATADTVNHIYYHEGDGNLYKITGPGTSVLVGKWQGVDGVDGADSTVPGPVGPTGPQGPAGADGAEGPQGPQGEKGDKGNTGATGPQGPAGTIGVYTGTIYSNTNFPVGSYIFINSTFNHVAQNQTVSVRYDGSTGKYVDTAGAGQLIGTWRSRGNSGAVGGPLLVQRVA